MMETVTGRANNLGNLSRGNVCRENGFPEVPQRATRQKEARDMFGISSNVIALGVMAIAALVLLIALATRKPKRVEKWEKAEIMKKLLALSEQEAGGRQAATAGRTRAVVSRPAPSRTVTRPANIPLKASVKTTLPVRSKAR